MVTTSMDSSQQTSAQFTTCHMLMIAQKLAQTLALMRFLTNPNVDLSRLKRLRGNYLLRPSGQQIWLIMTVKPITYNLIKSIVLKDVPLIFTITQQTVLLSSVSNLTGTITNTRNWWTSAEMRSQSKYLMSGLALVHVWRLRFKEKKNMST